MKMIDFIKLYWRDKSKLECFVIKEGSFEEVLGVLEFHSGEVRYPFKTSFSGMTMGITEKSGYLKNSIHKAYNILKTGEEHNHNDFTYSNIIEEIDYISTRIVDVENSRITQLEFGINITLDVPAENVIRRNVLMHKLKGANHNRKYFGKGELKQFDYNNYVIKIYDKAKQYNLDINILRFEIKFIKDKEFQNLGIFNIRDLKNKRNLRILFKELLRRFDELTIIDSYEGVEITEKDSNSLNKYKNPAFWEEDLRYKSRQTKSRHKKKFEDLLFTYDLLRTKEILRSAIISKYIYLINH